MPTAGRRKGQTHRYRAVRVEGAHTRQAGEGTGTLVSVDGAPLPVTERAASLSPSGYDWGSESSGGQALAHALLAYECGLAVADAVYEACARTLIAGLPLAGAGGTAWTLTSAEVRAWLAEHRRDGDG